MQVEQPLGGGAPRRKDTFTIDCGKSAIHFMSNRIATKLVMLVRCVRGGALEKKSTEYPRLS
jgi:hypothetical protein